MKMSMRVSDDFQNKYEGSILSVERGCERARCFHSDYINSVGFNTGNKKKSKIDGRSPFQRQHPPP